MNYLRLAIILLFTFNALFAQDFNNGEYTCNKTSFKDFCNQENNFVEHSRYNVSLQIQETKKEGIVIVQDPRIPRKPLIYMIVSSGYKIENDSITAMFYDAKAEHLPSRMDTKIGIYRNIHKTLNLLIIDSLSSQVFHDLQLSQ